MNDVEILSVEHVSKTFVTEAERLTILRDVNLRVAAGSTVSITGKSGCGKSTLLSIIGGLDRASSGSIVSAGLRLGPETREEELTAYRGSTVGFIFQFHYLMKDFTALENVMLPAYMNGSPRKSAVEAARLLLDEVGLSPRAGHYPAQLSGGERQRVAVARALVSDPVLVLADEPTGNLDESNTRVVADILFGLVERHGKTLLMVTHDRGLAGNCTTQLLLHDGELSQP